MEDCSRGKIRNREYAKQLRDFSGLRFGKITPTDIDAFLDFGDSKFVFIEAKHGTAPLPVGQRLALERLSDACEDAGRKTLVILASHTVEGDIDMANLPVTKVRFHKQWREREGTVREVIDAFLAWADPEKFLDASEG